MRKFIFILIILIFIILIGWLVYDYFFTPVPEPDGDIAVSVLIGKLIENPNPQASTRAVQDSQGLIYYSINTPEVKTITVLDNKGTEYKRWTSEDEQNIEIAGISDSQVIFYWTDSANPDCQDLWNTGNIYYGISFGTISYSGAGELLWEENEQLIDNLKQQCLNN